MMSFIFDVDIFRLARVHRSMREGVLAACGHVGGPVLLSHAGIAGLWRYLPLHLLCASLGNLSAIEFRWIMFAQSSVTLLHSKTLLLMW